jgi:hypothetical protein
MQHLDVPPQSAYHFKNARTPDIQALRMPEYLFLKRIS